MLAALMLERPADEPLSAGLRHVLHLMESIFTRDHDVILARAKLGIEVPALRARLWEELQKAQVLLSALVAQRAGRDPDDFEIRVVVMVVVTAAMEAMYEWVRHDGRGSFVELVNQALDVVDAGARLDAIASRPHP
jgi:hypothetical protein